MRREAPRSATENLLEDAREGSGLGGGPERVRHRRDAVAFAHRARRGGPSVVRKRVREDARGERGRDRRGRRFYDAEPPPGAVAFHLSYE